MERRRLKPADLECRRWAIEPKHPALSAPRREAFLLVQQESCSRSEGSDFFSWWRPVGIFQFIASLVLIAVQERRSGQSSVPE